MGTKAGPRLANGAQWPHTGTEGSPMASQKELRGDLYVYTDIPINRPSGQYATRAKLLYNQLNKNKNENIR